MNGLSVHEADRLDLEQHLGRELGHHLLVGEARPIVMIHLAFPASLRSDRAERRGAASRHYDLSAVLPVTMPTLVCRDKRRIQLATTFHSIVSPPR